MSKLIRSLIIGVTLLNMAGAAVVYACTCQVIVDDQTVYVCCGTTCTATKNGCTCSGRCLE